jgi:hypothetical protein
MKVVLVSNLDADRSPWDIPSNEVRCWAYVLGADTRCAERIRDDPHVIANYDVVLLDLTPNLFDLPALLRRTKPKLIIVGLVEGWVGNIAAIDIETQCDFVAACQVLDMLGILVESSLSYYRLYSPLPAKVQFMGIPFPKEWTDRLPPVPVEEREFAVWMPFALRDVRSGISHVLAFQRLKEQCPDLKGYALRSSDGEDDHLRAIGVDIELVPFAEWDAFYRRLSTMYAVLNLDHLPTWGRVVGECAAARVPYVGFDATHCARALGVLTSTPFDVGTSMRYIKMLISERSQSAAASSLYRRVTEEQYRRLPAIDEDTSRRRFWDGLDRALGDGASRRR